MKQTLIRLILFALFALLFLFVVKHAQWVLWAFVCTYILEGAITEKLK